MTIRDYFLEKLRLHSIRTQTAALIMDTGIAHGPEEAARKARWGDAAENYPTYVLCLLWKDIKAQAITWLTAHKPDQWELSVATLRNDNPPPCRPDPVPLDTPTPHEGGTE